MKPRLIKKKNNKNPDSNKKTVEPREEKIYEDINSRSFVYNFRILINHYKTKEPSLPAKPK